VTVIVSNHEAYRKTLVQTKVTSMQASWNMEDFLAKWNMEDVNLIVKLNKYGKNDEFKGTILVLNYY